jgi:hypothetical protein
MRYRITAADVLCSPLPDVQHALHLRLAARVLRSWPVQPATSRPTGRLTKRPATAEPLTGSRPALAPRRRSTRPPRSCAGLA